MGRRINDGKGGEKLRIRIIIIVSVLILEVLNYYCTIGITSNSDEFYSLTARYSARISFVLLVGLGGWIIAKGFLTLITDQKKKDLLLGGIAAFTVNHLIHFYFLYKNFEVNDLDLWTKSVSFGAIAYVILTIAPLYFWKIRLWTRTRYYLLHGFLILMIAICVFTYGTRLGNEVPLPLSTTMWMFKPFIGIGLVTIIGLLGRVSSDRKNWA